MSSRSVPCCRGLLAVIPMLVAIVACYFAKEFYPLSSFPMYSKFEPRTYLVYLASADGQPLPTNGTINMESSALKKRYGIELNRPEMKARQKGSHFDWTAEQKRPAGEATLAYLRETFAPQAFAEGQLDGLRLIDVRIRRENGKLEVTEEEVARLSGE